MTLYTHGKDAPSITAVITSATRAPLTRLPPHTRTAPFQTPSLHIPGLLGSRVGRGGTHAAGRGLGTHLGRRATPASDTQARLSVCATPTCNPPTRCTFPRAKPSDEISRRVYLCRSRLLGELLKEALKLSTKITKPLLFPEIDGGSLTEPPPLLNASPSLHHLPKSAANSRPATPYVPPPACLTIHRALAWDAPPSVR